MYQFCNGRRNNMQEKTLLWNDMSRSSICYTVNEKKNLMLI